MDIEKELNDIEYKICCHELSKEQVFTQMKQIISSVCKSEVEITIPNSEYKQCLYVSFIQAQCNQDCQYCKIRKKIAD